MKLKLFLITIAVLSLSFLYHFWPFEETKRRVFSPEMTYISLNDYISSYRGEHNETTIILGMADWNRDGEWHYRAIIDNNITQYGDRTFGFHKGFFERLTGVSMGEGCSSRDKHHGKLLQLVQDGKIRHGRSVCRHGALDYHELWKVAQPIRYHVEYLTRESHKERFDQIAEGKNLRLASVDRNYASYDRRVTVRLPILWSSADEPPIYSQLHDAIESRIAELAGVSAAATGAISKEGVARLSTHYGDKRPGGNDWQASYLVAGAQGVKKIKSLQMEAYKLEFECETSACGTIETTDFRSIVSAFRHMPLLEEAYDVAELAVESRPSFTTLLAVQDDAITRQAQDIRYPIAWIEL